MWQYAKERWLGWATVLAGAVAISGLIAGAGISLNRHVAGVSMPPAAICGAFALVWLRRQRGSLDIGRLRFGYAVAALLLGFSLVGWLAAANHDSLEDEYLSAALIVGSIFAGIAYVLSDPARPRFSRRAKIASVSIVAVGVCSLALAAYMVVMLEQRERMQRAHDSAQRELELRAWCARARAALSTDDPADRDLVEYAERRCGRRHDDGLNSIGLRIARNVLLDGENEASIDKRIAEHESADSAKQPLD